VLSLAAEGCSSPEIGSRLYLAVPTVKTHLHNAYEKLGVHNRPSAVAAAIRLGLLDVDADPGTAADA
jgi:ATP/maltotriose-dependent transcriptional regulator MalT